MGNPIICQAGDRGAVVRVVQKILHVKSDGIFGLITEEAVKDFQIAHLLKVDGIVGLATWRKLLGYALKPSSRQIKEIIVHCTATRAGVNCTVEDIRRWHKQQGWSDIGYHYVVYRDGSVHEGRDVNIAGAHCLGHNTYSIGVAYVGGVDKDGKTPKDTRTPAQKRMLNDLLRKLVKQFPGSRICGHRDLSPDLNHDGKIEPNEWVKACPCFDAQEEYKDSK